MVPDVPCEPNTILDTMNVAVIMIDCDTGMLRYVNDKVCADMSASRAQVVGRPYGHLFWPDFLQLYDTLVATCADGQAHTGVYFWAERSIWEQITGQIIACEGAPRVMLLTITNITDICRAEYEANQRAYYDQLLHLPNWQKMQADLSAQTAYDRFGLLHFDIARMANINAVYGWEVGNALLLLLRDWLWQLVGKAFHLYRIGDDEFCLLSMDTTLDALDAIAQRIHERFLQPWHVPPNDIYCNVEIGVAYGAFLRDNLSAVLYRNRELARTRRQKGRSYVLYDHEVNQRVQEDLALRQTLVNCIRQDMRGFSVAYQPVIHAQTLEWIGLEALCRWVTPEGVSIPPDYFIRVAEQMGMIHLIDQWVHRTAMAECVRLGLTERHFFLDVNISPTQRIDEVLLENMLANLHETGFPMEKLNVEITESGRAELSDDTLGDFHLLSRAGFTLSLDDFGTGYNSFDMLVRLPTQVLKTERAFISSLEDDPYQQYLIQTLINLAHQVGMKLITEGVETEAQQRLLQTYGADYFQGYLFSKPMTAEALAEHTHRFLPN